MQSIIVEGLGKRYKLGKRNKAENGLDRVLNILEIFSSQPRADKKNDLWALRDITLSVDKGEVLGIIGPNGAGKTTLLKILSNITPPTTGQAKVRGRVVSLLELGMGFQPDLSARENVYLNAALYGVSRQEVDEYYDELIEFAGLEKFRDSPVKHFSSGMYIRLAFSSAVHMRPDILLADEVLAVGDVGFQHKCMDRMREISGQGITTLFVSHDMDAIRRLCRRCIHLHAGEIVDEGDSAEVTARYEDAQLSSAMVARVGGNSGQVLSQVRSEHGSIRAVQLLSRKRSEVGAVRTGDEYYLALTFECLEEDAKAFMSFDVLAGDSIVFRTHPAEVMQLNGSGVYQAYVRVPKNLLAERDYSVNAGLRILLKDGENVLLNSVGSLQFRAYNPQREDFISGIVPVRPVGVVSPRLDWGIDPVEIHPTKTAG